MIILSNQKIYYTSLRSRGFFVLAFLFMLMHSLCSASNTTGNSNIQQETNLNTTDVPPSEQSNVPSVISSSSSNFQDQIVNITQTSGTTASNIPQQNVTTNSITTAPLINQQQNSPIQNAAPTTNSQPPSSINNGVSPSGTNSTLVSSNTMQPSPVNPTGSSVQQSSIYTIEATDGPSYLKAVKESTKLFGHDESLAAFAASALVPVKPDADYASVCIQKTRNGLFRIHSQNPAALGILTGKVDRVAFKALFKLNKWATFDYNVPANADGTGNITTYYGQIFLKHGDGTVHGDVICFARYR